MIDVVNQSHHEQDDYSEIIQKDFYIGRGSVLGNPYTSKPLDKTKAQFSCDSKKEAIDKYKNYLLQKIKDKDEEICSILKEIEKSSEEGTAFLVCFCKPSSCHGDFIKKIIDNRIESKRTVSLF